MDAIGLVLDVLNELQGRYIVTGSIVSSAYSQPRSTKDADFVVDVAKDELAKIAERLSKDFDREPQMSFETVTGKNQHRFQYKATPFLIEIFEANMDDPHDKARFERRQTVTLLGRDAQFPTPEDVIVGKLRWYARIRRQKDYDDIVQVLIYQWSTLDWQYIEHWADQHNSLNELQQVRQETQRLLKRE